MDSLVDLFRYKLRDIYSAELKLFGVLGEFAGEALDPEVEAAFLEHKRETEHQIERLYRIVTSFDDTIEEADSPGLQGLLRDKEIFLHQKPSRQILDIYNLWMAQHLESYEITAYEGLMDLAATLDNRQALELLAANLQEEEATLGTFKALAERSEEQTTDLVGKSANSGGLIANAIPRSKPSA
jgi:ferritin-like metal-binding protein YciE